MTIEARHVVQEAPTFLEATDLSAVYAARLLFISFRFSQGQLNIQRDIFHYLSEIRPSWRITNDFRREIKAAVEGPIRKFLGHDVDEKTDINIPINHTGDIVFPAIEEQINKQLQKMQRAFNKPSRQSLPIPKSIPRITRGIIEIDHMYFASFPNGRERRLKDVSMHNSYSDPYLSHFCYFGLEGHSTGMSEYDQMFGDMKNFYKQMIGVPGYRKDVELTRKLIELYSSKHSKQP